MATLTSQLIVKIGDTQEVNITQTHTVEGYAVIHETIVDTTSDKQILMAIDVSTLKHCTLLATQTMTVKTNNSGTPQETFTLQPNVPVSWNEGDTAIFAGDISALFVTNTVDGADGVLTVVVGTDA